MHKNNEATSGLMFGLGATLLWGSYPLWYKPLAQLSSYHLLSWRIVFAEICLIALIVLTGRLSIFRSTLKSIRLINVITVSVVLGIWWLLYIFGIMTGRVLEVAFGYFLSPIMSMVVSRFIFNEAMSKFQITAVMLALCGVVMMSFELLSFQSFPWIAIIIGFCYSFYGLFKKKVPGDPIVVQSLEIFLMLPFALLFLIMANSQGEGHVFFQSGRVDLLLIATGLITVLPLWWYSRAAKQLPMMTLSFLQFVPPTCNFLLAVFVYNEEVTSLKLSAFVFIWCALSVFTWDSIQKQRVPALLAGAKI